MYLDETQCELDEVQSLFRVGFCPALNDVCYPATSTICPEAVVRIMTASVCNMYFGLTLC